MAEEIVNKYIILEFVYEKTHEKWPLYCHFVNEIFEKERKSFIRIERNTKKIYKLTPLTVEN